MTTKRSPARPRLDRSRVIAAAIESADAEGVEGLSMRALAARLDVVPMALYKHVTDKEDLLVGMVDALILEFGEPAAGLSWRERVRARVLAARATLVAHPWLQPVIEQLQTRSETALAYMNAVTGEFIEGGVSVDLAHHAMHALGNRIWGFSAEAFQNAREMPRPDGMSDAEFLALMRERFPYVTAVALDAASREPAGCDTAFEFEFTLDLLLDAFERLREAGWRSR